MKTIINHIKLHKLKYGLGLILLIFAGGVSFKQIFDKTIKARNTKIEYIVVHYTANLDPKADAEANAIYLRNKKSAGCHYIVDDQEIIQCTAEENVAYAVGDKKWFGFIPKPWHKNKITNNNSLSFEMCLGGGRNDSLIIEQTAQYVAWQMVNKGMLMIQQQEVWDPIQKKKVLMYRKVPDLGRVVRHHDVSGKHCPKYYYLAEWDQNKEDRAF